MFNHYECYGKFDNESRNEVGSILIRRIKKRFLFIVVTKKMDNFNLKLYLSEIDSIKKYLDSSSDLVKNLNELDNYLEQANCVNHSGLYTVTDESETFLNLQNDSLSVKVNKDETKQKLLFKITNLINQSIDSTKIIMLVYKRQKK